MTNMSMVKRLLQWLASQGVQDICLCPGGRNSPFVETLSKIDQFQVHTAFDERSAGFFALGLAQKKQKAVAIITTSGTAVAEVLPAVMEAHYSPTPLVVISADRPRRMRGTGAPQTVDQVGMFGAYVETCVDLEGEFVSPQWSRHAPLHINVCFDEPLLDGAIEDLENPEPVVAVEIPIREWRDGALRASSKDQLQSAFQNFLRDKTIPLLIAGPMSKSESEVAQSFVNAWPGPVYCESTSGLRETAHPNMLLSGDRLLSKVAAEKKIDGVVRIGGVPTARLWRDLEKQILPVFSVSTRPFPGLSNSFFYCAPISQLNALSGSLNSLPKNESDLLSMDKDQQKKWAELLRRFPSSEAALVAWISEQVSDLSTVYLGNSLPIREWDLFSQRKRPFHVVANRGANGIDGQLSTALAFLSPGQELWVILGDLTALYDSNALWFWKKNPQPLKLVVVNNFGGRIFSRMFNSELFCNSHELNFEHWARHWGLESVKLSAPGAIPAGSCLIELLPNTQETNEFWQQFDSIWRS